MDQENQKRASQNLEPLTDDDVSNAKEVAGEVLVQEIHKSLDKGQTPVDGGAYKRKLADGKRVSRLLDEGDMRAHITHTQSASGVKVGVFKSAPKIERLKASGHNLGDAAHGVQREFIPNKGKYFKESILKKMNRAVSSELSAAPEKEKASQPDDGGVRTSLDIFNDTFLDSIIDEVVTAKVKKGIAAGTFAKGATLTATTTGVASTAGSLTALNVFGFYRGAFED